MIGRVLYTGGARSGKSTAAEQHLSGGPEAQQESGPTLPVRYVATAFHDRSDPEWVARIDEHRRRRPAKWRTIETLDVADVIRTASEEQPVLVDCLTLWLHGQLHLDDTRVRDSIDSLAAAVGDSDGGVVIVTNEVGSGIVPQTASGRRFRDLLGRANAAVAARCDMVFLVVAGCRLAIKSP